MGRRKPGALRYALGNVWLGVCVLAALSCTALVVRLLARQPLTRLGQVNTQLTLAVPALFGALAGIYGTVASIVLGLRTFRLRRAEARLQWLERHAEELETLRMSQRSRLEELSMLREVAAIVNQESDFTIIAEKVLELVHGLLEPDDVALFLLDEESGAMAPFAQYADGRALTGRKVRTKNIPDFDPAEFQSHGVVCRVRHRRLEAMVPLKVEEKTLGVLCLTFPADSRSAEQQRTEFNENRRRVLLEIAHHISLAVKTKHLHTQAVVDGLTRLYSRTHFNNQLLAAIEFATRNREPFSLLLIDIDHFKKVNDSYGHAAGDEVLRRIASRIRNSLRKYDTAYRYGGEELAVILPATRMKHAIAIAERFRQLIETQKVRAGGNLIGVTISLGVAQFEPTDDAESLFNRADRRLYRAKSEGRNRVVPAAA